jgi:hypothetical protein
MGEVHRVAAPCDIEIVARVFGHEQVELLLSLPRKEGWAPVVDLGGVLKTTSRMTSIRPRAAGGGELELVEVAAGETKRGSGARSDRVVPQ